VPATRWCVNLSLRYHVQAHAPDPFCLCVERGAYFSSPRMFEDKQLGEREEEKETKREAIRRFFASWRLFEAHKILPFSTPAMAANFLGKKFICFFCASCFTQFFTTLTLFMAIRHAVC
jgi:hypothetical protein